MTTLLVQQALLLARMHDQVAWVLGACAQALRPLLRLALAMGVKHAQLDRLLRDLLMEESRRLWKDQGVHQPNISQLAMTSGLNRKDVTARVRQGEKPLRPPALPPTALVYTEWLQMAEDDPAHRRLPIVSEEGSGSFEALARRATRGNVHHRAVLDDLVRLGMVLESDGRVELVGSGFVPSKDLQTLLAFLGSNTGDHLQAAVSNTLGQAPSMLERAVYADSLTVQECERMQQLVRQRWDTLHHEFVEELSRGIAQSAAHGDHRIKVGIYVYHEPTDASGNPPSQPPNPPANTP